MDKQRQFSLSQLCVAVTASAVACWLYVVWWQLLLLIAVSLLPAIASVLLIIRFRKKTQIVYSAIWLSLLSCLFLVLYVLSGGPMMWVDVTYLTTKSGDSTPIWLTQFYEPLELLNVPANPFMGLIEAYYKAWRDYCEIIQAGGV